MTAKKLKLVTQTQPQPGAPPRPLGKHGLALWRSVIAEYGLEDCGGLRWLKAEAKQQRPGSRVEAWMIEDQEDLVWWRQKWLKDLDKVAKEQ